MFYLNVVSKIKISILIFVCIFVLSSHTTHAAILLPGNISTCGELAAPGTYTLTQNISGGASTCLSISSDNVTIEGGAYIISGSGAVAIDTRARTGGPSGTLTEGSHAYTGLIINDLIITGYTTGLHMSGNSDTTGLGTNAGNGGDAGDVVIFYSTIGSIIANGGDTTTYSYGGAAGNISYTDTNLNISNISISTLGGTGTASRFTDGVLDLNYSGTLTKTNIVLSALSSLEDNATIYTSYPGGTWPITNTSLSTCGTLYATTTTTFTLTQNITNIDGTCFYIASNNITIDGAGYSITSASSTNPAYAITASYGDYDNLTIKNLDISNYINSIDSTQTVSLYSDTTLNISNETINADILDIKSVGVFSYASTTLSDLTSLTINNTHYGNFTSGLLETLEGDTWTARMSDSNRSWHSIASSADGKKLAAVVRYGGKIYTSTDSGTTWTARESSRSWWAITSSADGTKLAAVEYGGQIYTSTDSGVTWTPRESDRDWASITSSADGTKLAAVVETGQIYTSTDSGATWTPRESNRGWYGITSSADGTKLAAFEYGSYIYTSNDSGVTWTARMTDTYRNWYGITSSADGTKLAAVDGSAQIYTSTDSGATWIPQAFNYAEAITSSADGTKLAAVVSGGQIYTSTDSGVSWAAQASGSRGWRAIASSADGNKLAAVVLGGQIYTKSFLPADLSISIINPVASSTVTTFNPIVSWGSSVLCEYSYDNFASTTSADCALGGSDISTPSNGTSTLSIRGYGNGQTDTSSVTFSYIDQIIDIISPAAGATYQNNTWSPSIDYDITNTKTLTACYYSYDNFVSTSTANCSLNGTDIDSPSTNGSQTLSIKVVDNINIQYTNSVAFMYQFPWTARESNRNWQSITSDSTGQYLAAVAYNGYIYTSTDSGVTWVQSTSTPVNTPKYWYSITSSDDGTKLAAVTVSSGRIYTSTNSGVDWTEVSSVSPADMTINRAWYSITSSADGSKLAAVAAFGRIYTSSDNGVNWVQSTSTPVDVNRIWRSITSDSTGQYLAAVAQGGQIYTSTDLGVTWTAHESNRQWTSITSSDGGTKLAAAVDEGQIYTSTDSGVTWTPQNSGLREWTSITSSADGTKLAAVAWNSQIYTSTDSGVTWTARESIRDWVSITSSADGNKLAAVEYGGQIYTIDLNNNIDQIQISITNPSSGSTLYNTWAPEVNWSIATSSCYYSYDNFVSTSTANCSLNGTDISAPLADGSHTLSIRAIAPNGSVGNSSVTFSYYANADLWTTQEFNTGVGFIISSADGTKRALISGGKIYTSTDSGVTWTARDSIRSWQSIASSADGTKLAAVDSGQFSGGRIYTSTDSGVTWTPRDSNRQWQSIASSADGTKLAAVVYNGRIYTSTDSGVTWTPQESNRYWGRITSSADGSILAASVYGGQIYTSTTSGATWTPRETNRNWYGLASSADGTKLVAIAQGDQIYTSIDSGATWTPRESNRAWYSVASSADGTKITAVVNNGRIYTSTDSGVTWTAREANRSWYSIASSADGTKLTAVVPSGNEIYTKEFSPRELVVNILTPVATSTISAFNPIVSWGSAVSCEYSYDNTNWTTVDCANTGNDIPVATTTGSMTLYIRGTDALSNQDTDSSTFTLNGYYFCGVDSNWNNSSNWFSDNTCTTPTSIPSATRSVVFVMNSTSPIINSSVTTIPIYINTTNMTGPAALVGVTFADSISYTGTILGNATFSNTSYNTGTITGNATFLNSSHNEGTITGNATLNTDYYSGTTQTGATFTIATGADWDGEVQGTVYNGDNTPITNFTFTGTAANNGTINTNATFSGTTFTMGEVNGTATLNGFAQVVQGINTVINFFKQLTSERDTLYFEAGSTLNVSGLFTLLGYNANNLLTVRSLTPGSPVSFGINGTSNFNFLRLKDITNTGTSLNLSSKKAFDDGGNTGFTFPSNTTAGSRGGITRPYTTPALPVSRGGTAPSTNTNNNTTGGGTSNAGLLQRLLRNTLNPLIFTPLPTFNTFSPSFRPVTIGGTFIPDPFQNFQAPGLFNLVTLPTNFMSNLYKFVFEPIPKTITDILTRSPQLEAYVSAIGLSKYQELAALTENPAPLRAPVSAGTTPPGLFILKSGDQPLASYATYDKDRGGLTQLVYVSPNQPLTLSLIPQSQGAVSATYLNQTLTFTQDSLFASISIQTPTTGGRYVLTSPAAPLPLIIDVLTPIQPQPTSKPWGVFNFIYNWIH